MVFIHDRKYSIKNSFYKIGKYFFNFLLYFQCVYGSNNYQGNIVKGMFRFMFLLKWYLWQKHFNIIKLNETKIT